MAAVKLDDTTIAQIVRLIQLGILTGTDISDQLRTLELVVKNDRVLPSPEYMEIYEENITAMQAVADHAAAVSTD